MIPLLLPLLLAGGSGEPIPPSVLAARRARLAEILPEGAVALVPSAPYGPPEETFRQDPAFHYFTGLEIPNAVLWVEREAGERIERLFVPSRDERLEEGRLGVDPHWIFADDALRARSGIETFDFVVDVGRVALRAIVGGKRIFAARGASGARRGEEREGDEFAPPDRAEAFLEALERYAGRDRIEDLGRFVARLRQVKDPHEIERIRAAGRITAAALRTAAGEVVPGAAEAEIEGVLEASLRRGGAVRSFFPPSVRSGPGAMRPRSVEAASYDRDGRSLGAGEVVVLEAGAEVEMYGCALARTFPVGGPFSGEARRAVEILAQAIEAVAAAARPGATLAELEARAISACPEAWRPRFECGVGAFLGMERDDPADPERPLEAGMVLVLAPRVVDEAAGTAAAITDTLLVTEEGGESLTPFPARPSELEALVRAGR